MRRTTELDQQIGKNIKKIRNATGYTLTQVGNVLSISGTQLQKYETGVNRISASKLMYLAIALDIDILEFYR